MVSLVASLVDEGPSLPPADPAAVPFRTTLIAALRQELATTVS